MHHTVLDYFEQTLRRCPEKAAFADMTESYSYERLSREARAIGTSVAGQTAPCRPVLVYMEKRAACLAAFLGAVYAGCFYVPVDAGMPADRVRLITDCLDPAVILCDADSHDKALQLQTSAAVLTLDEASSVTPDEALLTGIRRRMKSTDLLYVLFTSGSTGVPKGVTISHLAVTDFTEWICERYGFDEHSSFCNQAPFYFDASVPDLFIPLYTGATTFIPPKTYYTFPKKILRYVAEHAINTLIWVPSALCNVVNCKAFDVCVPDCVKTVIFCGEVMPCKHLNVWRKHIPDALYVNMYGPTEATYACTYYEIRRDFADDEALPLGAACENSTILLFENDRRCAPGEIGELCITGQCLSQGYYNAPERTAAVFVQNPAQTAWTETMYRTGDLAYEDADGNLIFAGRKDDQIKRLGHRIELGEIETHLRAAAGVSNACCLFDHETNDIIAVYAGDVAEQTLLEYLREKLPDYMIPTRLVHTAVMPMNLNGKIDRQKLKEEYVKGSPVK